MNQPEEFGITREGIRAILRKTFNRVFPLILVAALGGISIPILREIKVGEKENLDVFDLIPVGIIALFLLFSIFRTPGTVFIENVIHIKTPEGTIVLKDQYQNSFQDHSIECNLQFDQKGNKAYIQAIKRSPDFDPKRFESKDLEYTNHSKNGTWCRTENGYRFNRFRGNEVESIYFDTSARTLYYEGGSF